MVTPEIETLIAALLEDTGRYLQALVLADALEEAGEDRLAAIVRLAYVVQSWPAIPTLLVPYGATEPMVSRALLAAKVRSDDPAWLRRLPMVDNFIVEKECLKEADRRRREERERRETEAMAARAARRR